MLDYFTEQEKEKAIKQGKSKLVREVEYDWHRRVYLTHKPAHQMKLLLRRNILEYTDKGTCNFILKAIYPILNKYTINNKYFHQYVKVYDINLLEKLIKTYITDDLLLISVILTPIQ
jgi:hypothetical protein